MKRAVKGFTLIEMVITIVITGIIGATVSYSLTNGVRAYQSTSQALDTVGKLRVASERLARELRGTRLKPSDSSRYDVTEPFASSSISFIKDDGTTVNIATAGSTVTLAYNSPAGTYTLTDQLSSLTFNYYQDDGTSASTGADSLAYVEFELVLTDANGTQHAQLTRVGLRDQP